MAGQRTCRSEASEKTELGRKKLGKFAAGLPSSCATADDHLNSTHPDGSTIECFKPCGLSVESCNGWEDSHNVGGP